MRRLVHRGMYAAPGEDELKQFIISSIKAF